MIGYIFLSLLVAGAFYGVTILENPSLKTHMWMDQNLVAAERQNWVDIMKIGVYTPDSKATMRTWIP